MPSLARILKDITIFEIKIPHFLIASGIIKYEEVKHETNN